MADQQPQLQTLRLVAYLRVSSNAQAEADTIQHQRRTITTWAKRNGYKIVRFCEDEAVSGTKDLEDRPGLACVVDALESHEVDGVVFTALDRIARTLTVQEAVLSVMWRSGARVFAIATGEVLADDPEDPMRTFVRQVMGAAAQLERGLVRTRLEGGRRAKRAAGGYAGHGSPHFGVRAEGRQLVTDAEEASTVARIVELRRAGRSFREIAHTVNDEGHTAKRGGPWIAPSVRRVCIRAGIE